MKPASTSTSKSGNPAPDPPPRGTETLAPSDAELLADPEFQAKLKSETQQRRLRNNKVACVLVIALMPLGTLLDMFVYFAEVPRFLKLRLICALLAGILLALHYTPFGCRRVRWLGAPIALLPAFFISLMIARVHGFDSPYYAGINLVLLAVNVIVHWTFWESLATSACVLLFYTVAGFAAPVRVHDSGIVFNNYYFLVLTCIVVVTGNTLYNRLRLREFMSGYQLDRSRRLLERSYQQLRDLDAMKGRFFANISHELRTPLTLLIAPLERLRDHPACRADPRLSDMLATMNNHGLRLLKLINDLLDLVRLDARGLTLNRTPIDAESFSLGLINSLGAYAQDRGIKVACHVDPGMPRVFADPDKLEKILLNLLFNSIKFTPAGGQVSLRATRDANMALFEVSDTGVGIATENLPRLFSRFWQADASSQRKYQGAGLGLALVKELTEAHGGSVEARSQLGHGTTMIVRLPLASDSAPPAASPAASAPQTATPPPAESTAADTEPGQQPEPWLATLYRRAERIASIVPLHHSLRPWTPEQRPDRPRVLIADDEPDMRRFLRSQLEDDYEVAEAVDGSKAVALATQYLPDALVCDMMMPEKDGFEVCRELRACHSTRQMPILLLTARADEETKLHGLAAGASDFLAKPFSTAELRLRLKNLVDAHRLEQELARQNQKLTATIEQLQETELQLVQSAKMAALGRMSAGIIHEINNPLNFVKTGLFTLGRQARALPLPDRASFDEILHDMQEGVDRVVGIVSDLRGFSHPQGGLVETVDLPSTVEVTLRFLAAEWRDKVQVQNNIPPGFAVPAVRSRLVHILINVLHNSCDALRTKPDTGEPPTIRLDARTIDGWHIVTVWDNGPGIAPDDLPRIFDPFFTTKDVGQGTGLGLSICHRLMNELGGRISVKSEPGRFCEFALEFPADMRESPGANPSLPCDKP